MADVLTVQDLEAAKKHDTFHSEVITGRAGGSVSGSEIDTATNTVTGQVQTTLPKVLRDIGFKPASFTFVTGGTLGVTDADKCIYNPAPAGDGNWYSWGGNLPHTVAPGADPTAVAGYVPRTDVVLRADLAATSGAGLVGTADGSTVAGRLLALKRVSPIEARFAGGADPTGVADSTDALQACIDYCAPFVWQGSVAATKAAMGNCVAAMSGFGKFRITRPLKINPFLVITADQVGAHFGDNSGFQIIADFTDKDAFALDTAPYNSSGVRVLGMLSNRVDWDGGGYTGCPGWLLRGVEVTVAPGRNIRGTLNRNMAQQSHLEYCNLWGGNIGVQSSCCWGGSMRLNLINGRAIGVYNTRDTTVDEQQANYITVGGAKPVSGTEFTYPTWPDSTLQGKTTPCYNEYAHPNFFHNILEGGQIAIMCTNQSSLHLLDNYIEGSFEYCYAFHSVTAKVAVRWVISEAGHLLYAAGSTVDVDTTGASYLSVLGWGGIDAYSTVRVKGDFARVLPWHNKIDYTDAQFNGIVDVYVSASGDDANSGYLQSKPVKTLQEAIDRCKAGFYNKINLISGLAVTKYNYTSGGNTTNKIVRLDTVEINGEAGGTLYVGSSSNQLESLPMGISRVVLRGISSITVDYVSDNYKPMIPAFGVVNIEITSCSMSGGVLTGVKNGRVGMANITAHDSTLACQLQHNGGVANSFSWIDTAVNTNVSGGSVGSAGSKKISSVLYP